MQDEHVKEKIDLVSTPDPVDAGGDSVEKHSDSETDFPSLGERYQPLEAIGHGGMGMVYKARDTITGNIVAIKVLKKELTRDKTALRRFEQEVASLAELDHTNLVTLYGQGQTADGAPYLVMEFIEGKSLAEILEEEKKLSPERAMDLILQITEGLAHAHKKGIVHRDLKPSNIMIHRPAEKFETDAPSGSPHQGIETVRILDFGIARIVESTTGSTTGLTQTGDVFGTPNYMSPEQCEGKPIDSVSDIYSLGCILYELLTGKLPFEGSNPIQVAVKHINDKPPGFPVEKRKRLKQPLKSLESITHYCLNKNKTERYQSIEEFAADIRKVRAGKKVKRSANHQRSKNIHLQCGLALTIFLSTFVALHNQSRIMFLDAGPEATLSAIATIYLVLNTSGTLTLTYCVFRDRAGFRKSNRTMDDYWNLLESSAFAISMWSFLLLYALALGFDPASSASSLVATPLSVVALTAGMIALIIEFGFLILHFRKKTQLEIPFARDTAKLQTAVVFGGAGLLGTLVTMLYPFVTAWVVDAGAVILAPVAPHTASVMADAALSLTPESVSALDNKVITDFALQKRAPEILRKLNDAIAKSPKNAELYALRAKVFIALDNDSKAISDYTSAISHEERAEYFQARARILELTGQELAAIADYSEALKRDPTKFDLYTSRGVLYAKVKDFNPAIQDLSTAIASNSAGLNQGEWFLRRGIVYELAGDQHLATQDYKFAFKQIDSLNYFSKMFVYKRLGMKAEYDKELSELSTKRTPKELRDDLSETLFKDTVDLPFQW